MAGSRHWTLLRLWLLLLFLRLDYYTSVLLAAVSIRAGRRLVQECEYPSSHHHLDLRSFYELLAVLVRGVVEP